MKKLLLTTMLLTISVLASAYDAEVDGIYYNLDPGRRVAEVTYRYLAIGEINWTSDARFGLDGTDMENVCAATFPQDVWERLKTETFYVTVKSDEPWIRITSGWWVINWTGDDIYPGNERLVNNGDGTWTLSVNLAGDPLADVIDDQNLLITGGRFTLESIYLMGSNAGSGSGDDDKFFLWKNDSYRIEAVNIPEKITYEGVEYTVTSIGTKTFRNCSNLTSLTIPNSVTTIGSNAFQGCSGLASLTIPNSITNIGSYAFAGCSGLTSLTIPQSVTAIGFCAFEGCSSLTSIKVEGGNTVYDSRENCNAIIETSTNTLFAGCKNTIIPNSVTSIGNGAFYNCSGLTSITIPSSVTLIGNSAFNGCSGLSSLTIPNSVTTIGNSAFAYCRSLTSLSIPNSVDFIAGNAFNNCTGLTSVTIPNSVTSIGQFAFADCSGLTEVISLIEEPFAIDTYVWYGLNTDQIPLYVPAGCKAKYEATEGWNVFKNIEEMGASSSIAIDETNFPDDNFRNWVLAQDYGQDGVLTEAEIDGVTGIDIDSQNIADLKGIEYFTALTQLWCDYNELTSLDVSKNTALTRLCCAGNQLTSLDLSQNTALITLYCYENQINETEMGKLVESLPANNGELLVKRLDVSNEQNVITTAQVAAAKAKGWYVLALDGNVGDWGEWVDYDGDAVAEGNIVFADEAVKALCVQKWDTNGDGELSYDEAAAVTDLGEVFKWNDDITSFNELQYFTGLTCIGEDAFNQCHNLASVSIPNSVTSIGVYAFLWCFSLSSITIPNSVTSIGRCAFEGCSNLLTVIISNSVTNIADYSFSDCSSLSSITIPNSVTSIGWGAFEGCSNLLTVIIPNSVTSIMGGAFNGCTGLTSIEVEAGNSCFISIDGVLFDNNKTTILRFPAGKTTSAYSIPNSVTTIGQDAFEQCRGLTNVTIPNSVTSIEWGTFNGCIGLTSIEVEAGNSCFISIDGVLFDKKQTSIFRFPQGKTTSTYCIPNSVTGIEAYAFYGCSSLTSITIPNSVTSIGFGAFSYCSNLLTVIIPNSVTNIAHEAFEGCENLTSVTIPNSVNSIGAAFSNCPNLKEVFSLIKDPFPISEGTFETWDSETWEYYYPETLYVPSGCKEKYEATAGWNVFKNIVEMGLLPVDEGETIDIGNEINEETNLDGTVVDNVFVNIRNGDGGFDPVEGCLIVSKPTDDSAINGKDIFGDDFKDNYTGIVFKVNEGKGSIKVEAETQGNMVLKVKIGNSDPIEMELDGKLKVKFPYNVSEPTYVYIYGGMSTAGAKATGGTRASADADLLKIYGFEVVSDASGIDAIENGLPANADAPVYNLNGQRVDTPTKGIYIKNGRKVLVK